ncbi:MAG TPA: hypothetical protein VMH87_15845 [Pseudomonadales bacterium]|nr:hypothetical protein [Pseudomonadales bacterium]
MRLYLGILALALVVTGCETKSHADARVRAAYLAGQEAAYKSAGTQQTVVVLGDVQKHEVSFVEGLTLAQAIGTANYTGMHDPKLIIVKRGDQQTPIDPKALLNGKDMPLQAGDIITVIGQ